MFRCRRYRSGKRYLALSLIASRVLFGVALASVIFGFIIFNSFSVPAEADIRRTSAAVVFTGGFDRVDAGLQLLETRSVPILYISGWR